MADRRDPAENGGPSGDPTQTAAPPDFPKEDDPARTFRGFPQPEANERLESIKIFLADEDPDRHLYWETHFAEINEYLAHIDEHNVDCDATLLKKVKNMAQVHKDWQEDRDRKLPSGCVHANEDAPKSARTSTRLVDAETSATQSEVRKAFGVDIVTRTDHPPFTITRAGDEAEFVNAMLKDATEDPRKIVGETNLRYVENRAYNWALLQPAMIPYWLHPTEGIPAAGQKVPADPTKKDPWYIKKQPIEVDKQRPVRTELPAYLKAREDTINFLLRKDALSNAEFAKLEELLRLHEPPRVHRLWTQWMAELGNSDGKENASVITAKEAYLDARKHWLETFRFKGVYLVELREGKPYDQPGVFYLPSADAITKEDEAEARADQLRLDMLMTQLRLAGSYRSLDGDAKYAIDLMLIRSAPEHFKRERDVAKFSTLGNDHPLAVAWAEWVDSIARHAPTIVLLAPGEMDRGDPSLLCIPWQPHSSTSFPPAPKKMTDFEKSWEVEALLKKHNDPRFELSVHEKERLGHLVSDFYMPWLLKLSHEEFEKRERKKADDAAKAAAASGHAPPPSKPGKTQARAVHFNAVLEELKTRCDEYMEIREEKAKELEEARQAEANKREHESTAEELQEQLYEIDHEFVETFENWYTSLSAEKQNLFDTLGARPAARIDFTGKAERRGIQRAAIEIGLNLLATNQEQHRLEDRFRVVKLPPVYQPPAKEVPLALPLEDFKRPVERDPFEFSKKVTAYQHQKDLDYKLGRARLMSSMPGQLTAPVNYNGPFVVADGFDKHVAAKTRLFELARYKATFAAAQENSPRPLIQQILRRISWYSNPESKDEEGLELNFSTLDQRQLDILEELGGHSWNECEEEYNWDSFGGDGNEIGLFKEYEGDLKELMGEIPLWQAPINHNIPIEDDIALCTPVPYNASTVSTTGLSLTELVQRIRNMRLLRGAEGNLHLWTEQKALGFLRFMKSFSHIHLDEEQGQEPQISRVPLTGHPENKYVTSVADAVSSPGVYLTPIGHLEVRYDVHGCRGPPIVQPNKIQHFLKLAQVLGREILDLIETLAVPALSWRPTDILAEQLDDLEDAKKLMKKVTVEDRIEGGLSPALAEAKLDLKTLAIELDAFAPDLAQEAGFVWEEDIEEPDPSTIIKNPRNAHERQLADEGEAAFQRWQQRQSEYAALLQMQILEEINNNFELRFPEKEHVWDFASHRVRNRTETLPNGKEIKVAQRKHQFFSMRRWPLECQSEEVQKMITESANPVAEKPAPPAAPKEKTREEILNEAITPQKKKARHIRGRAPHFPFGETPFQQAYLSYRMEEDLKDVPGFQVKPDKRWNFPWTTRPTPKRRTERFALPKIPANWKPDNISYAHKKHVLTEWARSTEGFPDPNILEYYYTQDEIPHIQQRDARAKLDFANQAVEKELGKSILDADYNEIRRAREKLYIDPSSGFFLEEDEKAEKVRREERARMRAEKQRNKKRPHPIFTDGGAGPPGAGNGGAVRSARRRAASGWVDGGQGAPKRARFA